MGAPHPLQNGPTARFEQVCHCRPSTVPMGVDPGLSCAMALANLRHRRTAASQGQGSTGEIRTNDQGPKQGKSPQFAISSVKSSFNFCKRPQAATYPNCRLVPIKPINKTEGVYTITMARIKEERPGIFADT
ncbi:hypothetical protein EUGRSUZ_J01275 [Eucalyptus grandis]|uniref:Uncharacterized protein n=2 Tax=Eucalyptus grandis TaxID=71139 RepID=A0ACC3J4H6_EUCGR|nr:hypothetical protein EUGRSUZ_J01275 [Eucalyptus grandis]